MYTLRFVHVFVCEYEHLYVWGELHGTTRLLTHHCTSQDWALDFIECNVQIQLQGSMMVTKRIS